MKIPSRLSYRRSLSPSHGVFTFLNAQEEKIPLPYQEIKIVGQKESAAEAFDKNMDIRKISSWKTLAEGNPQFIEYCHVPYDAKRLLCNFSLTVSANTLKAELCNDDDVAKTIKEFLTVYKKRNGFVYLSERYLRQILSGAWLWRNQDNLSTQITIKTNTNRKVVAKNVHQLRFEQGWEAKLPDWSELVSDFAKALVDPMSYLICEIEAEIIPATCQEVYPSQAFTEKNDNRESSRIFQKTRINGQLSPVIGCYKIGAGISIIDDWFKDAVHPIRVGRYGVEKSTSSSLRTPDTGTDFFTLLTKIESITEALYKDKQLSNEANFIAANLIKGGLFQPGDKK
ncbi:MAG: type I-F CRISPR-associated protein Csy3 [Paraglaciecola sp.]|uniref:type I-F CRISPR-associated protein Csy3 n=1 Tax=Alishewanella sp. HL-SH05 TaxID=3461145 RepID=UPI002772DD8B|nr:type I-F CRISPR-associated protein Csy3 [Paraglaciecola sp.]